MIKRPDAGQMLRARWEAYAHCEALVRDERGELYEIFSLLPRQKACYAYTLAAFWQLCAEASQGDSPQQALSLLQQSLPCIVEPALPEHPVFQALSGLFITHEMDLTPFEHMVQGYRMRLEAAQPVSQLELEAYSYHLEGTAMLMLLPLLTDEPEALRRQAVSLGVAYSLTTMLRYIGRDLRRGYVRLPKERMQAHGYTMEALCDHRVNQAFIQLWEEEAMYAELLYDTFLTASDALFEEVREPVLVMTQLERSFLDDVRQSGYRICMEDDDTLWAKRAQSAYQQLLGELSGHTEELQRGK